MVYVRVECARNATSSRRNVAGKYKAVYLATDASAATAGSGVPVATWIIPNTSAMPLAPTATGRAAERSASGTELASSANAAQTAPATAARYQPRRDQSSPARD